MAMTVKVKRKSSGTGAPGSLAYGELAVDTAGSLWVGNSVGSPVSVGGGTFSGSYSLVEEIVRESDTTNQDFAATLSGNTDKGYFLEVMLINNSGATASYTIRMNGAGITATQQYSFAYGASLYAASESTSRFMALGTTGIGQVGMARIDLPFMTTGHERFYRWESSHAGSGATVDWWAAFGNFSSPSTSTNITSIGIGCDQTNGIGTGSILRLYKWNGA